MPSQKGKGCPASHRYRPASEYDDATLAQKREYWRNKKREQRARLSEQRKKSTQNSSEEKLSYMYVSAGVNTNLSDPMATLSSPLLSNDVSYSSLSKSERTIEHSSTNAPKKQERHQAMTVSKVLRNLQPTSCSILATTAEGGSVTVKRPTTKSLRNLVTSSKSSGTELNTSSSVPPVRVTPITSSSSTKTEPKPCGSMQDSSVPNTPSEAQVALNGLQVLPGVTTDTMRAALCGPVFNKTEGQRTHTTPQSGLKSALVTIKRATCFGITPAPMESEEERVAKRREHWRIKTREQRAKLAAKTTKVRERPQSRDGLLAQKTILVANSTLTSQSFLRGTGQKRNPVRVKVPYTTVRLETDNLQSGLAVSDLQKEQRKVQNPHGHKMEKTAVTTFNTTAVRKPAESQRKLTYVHHSNITQETSSCKTLRQRSIETQKNFLNQRNLRNKPFLTAAGFRTRPIPTMDTNDTPEQILAKRREYWRNKKREQRAKLSLEKKIQLKEKDSLTRRVKRYQQILEEMRKARALAHSTEKTPTLTSEAIGGFIKEDGTLTINIPQSAKYQSIDGDISEEKLHDISKKLEPTSQTDMNWRSVSPCRVNWRSPLTRSSQGKAAFSFVQTVNKTSKLIAVKPQSHLDITTSSSSKPSKSVQQLTLTHLQSPQNAASATGSKFGGCVMKMSISSRTPSLPLLSVSPKLSEEERMAKKREYWRTKKREQRAARASRLKHSIFQARTSAGLLRRRMHTQELNTMQLSTNLNISTEKAQHFPNNSLSAIPHANEIKQEEGECVPAADLNSLTDRAICPDKPPTSPPAPPEPEPETSLSSDSQATTLLAVASMKKLLEESLSSVSENQTEQAGLAIETTEDASEQDIKPVLSQLHCEKNDKDLLPACLTSQIKSLVSDSDLLEGKDLQNPQLNDAVLSLSTSSEVGHSTCVQSSQTSSTPFITTVSSCGTQRSYSSNWTHQSCWSEELPKLHHITTKSLDPQQQHHLDRHDQQSHNSSVPPAERFCRSMTRKSSSNSLQEKREYWKLMKRQQRARLKARQKEILSKNTQTAGLDIASECVNPSKPSIQPCSSVTSVPDMISIPDILVGSSCKAKQSPDALCVQPPIISREGNVNDGPSSRLSDFLGVSSPNCQKWTIRAAETEAASSLPTLKPPDNPLTRIHLQPIELPDRHQNPILSPIKISCAQLQSPINKVETSAQAASICIMMPPKPVPGESEEDFLKRKREYWRLKKKEQRAKKAFQYKGCTSTRGSGASSSSSSDLPGQDLQTLTTAMEDSSQWVNSSDASENLMSIPVDPDPPPFMYTNCPAKLEGEADILFADHGDDDHDDNDEEEDSMSEAVWRNRYLMDYDPLNQLLVCMVCGELQYSHSLEGVRAHIDEAHPLTLRLEPREKQRILEGWDEQVSQRERFFSSQLQQHCGAAEETYRN